MTGKASFTEDEWKAMHKGVTGAGLLVSVSDRGFFDSFKEAGALAKHLAGSRDDSSSEVVRELAKTRGIGFGLTSSPGEVESETVAALHTSSGSGPWPCAARASGFASTRARSTSSSPARGPSRSR